MIRRWIPVTATIVCVVAFLCAVAPAVVAGGKRCTYGAQECLDYLVERYRKRGWMGVETETDEVTRRVTITYVHRGAPADARLLAGDVILSIGGVDLCTMTAEKDKALDGVMKPGATVSFTIERDKRTFEQTITLVKTPDWIVARAVGEHMLEHTDLGSDRSGKGE